MNNNLDEYIKWIQLFLNLFAIGACGWIYKAYIENLKASISSKDEQLKTVEKNMAFWKDKATDLEKRSPEAMEVLLSQRIKIREDEIARLSSDSTAHKKELEIQQQELSILKSELEKTRQLKTTLSFTGDDFDDYFFSRQGDLEIVEMGVVGVDSGQLMITDPCYIDSEWKKEEFEDLRIYKDNQTGKTYQFRKDFQRYDEKIEGFELDVNQLIESNRFTKIEIVRNQSYSYAGACAATLSEDGYGQLNYELGHEGAGVAFHTAFGDGTYPVYGEKYDGRIIRVYVNVI